MVHQLLGWWFVSPAIPASLTILGRDPEHQIAPDASISVCVIVC